MRVLELKRTHGTLYLMKFEEDQVFLLFRLLTWGEYRAYREILFQHSDKYWDLADDIIESCLLKVDYGPKAIPCEHYNDMPFGIMEALLNVILTLSGSSSAEGLMAALDQARSTARLNVEQRIIALLSNVLHYSVSELENMSWNDIVGLIGQLELILSGDIPAIPFSISTDNK